MEALITLITHLGVPAILAVVYAESGLLIGFFLPGDSLLFTAGFLVHQNILPINIHLFVFLLIIAAVLGDNTGYAFGNKVGRKIFERKSSKFFHPENLRRAEAFYEKHGSKAIVLARFVPVVRTFAPIVAGASSMHYRTFLTYNIIGGVIWATLLTYLGYYAGEAIHQAGFNIEIVAIIIILISVLPMIIHLFNDKDRRLELIAATKNQIKTILRPSRRKK